MFRGYSAERRDRAPLIETEDFRDEGARRFWDDFSPPYFGFKKGPNDTYAIHLRELRASPAVEALLGLLAEPHFQHRSGALQVVGLRLHLFLRLGRRRPAGFQRSLPVSAARWMPCACPRRSISPIA